jgi:exodeoxyribonuclease-5
MTAPLSPDQMTAHAAICAAIDRGQKVTTLVGPAGSGKTTLMAAVLDTYAPKRHTVLVCPSGKAASVLSSKTGRVATTIHKALYSGVKDEDDELVFTLPGPPCEPGGLVICDEASMVGVDLHDELVGNLPKGAQLLYVGDREQLPPVNQSWGPGFDAPDAALTTVHRQAEQSPILQLATAIRTRQHFAGWVPGACESGAGDPVAWLAARAEQDATLLAYTNKTRTDANQRVRAALGRRQKLEVGDRVVCLLNNSDVGMMNGEVGIITKISRSGRASVKLKAEVYNIELDGIINARINLDMIGGAVRDFNVWKNRRGGRGGRGGRGSLIDRKTTKMGDVLHIDHGWCLTVHKSQGSEWSEVGFIADGGYRWLKSKSPDDARRLAYTAVTRARDSLRIFA